MAAVSAAAVNFATQMQACSAGDEIVTGGWFQPGTGVTARTCQIGATFYTSAGAVISTIYSTDATATVLEVSGSWVPAFGVVTGTQAAPAGAAWCRAADAVKATSEFHYFNQAWLSDPTTGGQTEAVATAFFNYVQLFMQNRLAAGKPTGEVILFNQGVPGTQITSIITNPAAYRVPLWQQLHGSLNNVTPAFASGSHAVAGLQALANCARFLSVSDRKPRWHLPAATLADGRTASPAHRRIDRLASSPDRASASCRGARCLGCRVPDLSCPVRALLVFPAIRRTCSEGACSRDHPLLQRGPCFAGAGA